MMYAPALWEGTSLGGKKPRVKKVSFLCGLCAGSAAPRGEGHADGGVSLKIQPTGGMLRHLT